MSITVVTMFCCTPWVTVASVPPFSVTEIDCGGQVVKYPADDPEPATDAVIAVVPGCCAVITLVVLFRFATLEVPTVVAQRADSG